MCNFVRKTWSTTGIAETAGTELTVNDNCNKEISNYAQNSFRYDYEIERSMKKLGYAVHHREVFKKNPAAKFTFEHSCTVKKFLSILSNNERIEDVIVPHFSKLESMLADPECEFTRPIRINYDLIEVWVVLFNQQEAICGTPRQRVRNSESLHRFQIARFQTKVPDARYFQES